MSPGDDLRFDADGFVDMDAFPDDGTELDPAALSDLREALLSDPVDEPAAVEWDALLDAALDAPADDGPFAVDGSEVPATDDPLAVPDDDLAGWLDTDLGADDVDAAADGAGAPAADEPADEPFAGGADPHGFDVLDALELDPGAGAGADPFDPDPGSAGDGVGDDAGFDLGDAL